MLAEDGERERLFERRIRDHELPRPCYYFLRILGLWHPLHSPKVLVILHHIFAALLMAGSCFSVLYLDKIQNHNKWVNPVEHPLEIMNSCCTMVDFICPFLFTMYYFTKGRYNEVISKEIEKEDNKNWLRYYSKVYSTISIVLWILCFMFFWYHWEPFFNRKWHTPVYIITTTYITGCWAIWLTVYGYVCEAHCVQLKRFSDDMEEIYERSNRTTIAERECLNNLLERHSALQDSLERTQRDFNVMISLAVAYHVFDIIIFSCAYWHYDFGPNYPIYQYLGTLTFDMSSIIIKVYPAGKVAQSAHRITRKIAIQCTPNIANEDDEVPQELPPERLEYFHYAAIFNQDLGFRILGIRITVNVALAIIVTVVIATVSFTSAIIPRLQHHNSTRTW